MTDRTTAGRPARRPGVTGAVLVTVVSLLLLGVLILGDTVFGWSSLAMDAESLLFLGMMLLFLALGPLILWKAGGNRLGWVFSAIGLSLVCSAIAAGLTDAGFLVAGAIGGGFWLGWITGLGVLVLWFPTGRVPSRRWLWVERLGFALVGLTFLSYTFTEQICAEEAEVGCGQWVANPLGIPGMPNPEYGWLSGPLFALFPFFMGAVVFSLFLRFRRARSIERLQLKWFLLACGSAVTAMAIEFALERFGFAEPPLWLGIWIDLSLLSIPVSAALAILRYRLYEIDRIVSRTVSYALVIGLLGAVYLGGVTWLGSLLPDQSQLAVAAATLAVAALFNPVRKRVQAWVDRRFNRSRYDTERVMDQFSGSLRDEIDPNGVVAGWVGVVSETMQPAAMGVWVR